MAGMPKPISDGPYMVPRSGAEVKRLIDAIGLQAPARGGLEAISRRYGARFAEAIAKVANKQSGYEDAQEFVLNVLYATSSETISAILDVGIEQPPMDDLLRLAEQSGAKLRTTIRMCAADSASRFAAKEYLKDMLDSVQSMGAQIPLHDPDTSLAMVGHRDARHEHPVNSARNPAGVTPAKPAAVAERAATGSPRRVAAESRTQPHFPANDPRGDQERFDAVRIYGSKAALCFSPGMTRADGRSVAKHTVNIDASNATGMKSYDWANKVIFQLGVSELPLVVGVLYGYLDALSIAGHGQSQEKTFTIENQGKRFYMAVKVLRHGVYGVPVMPHEIYPIYTMIMRQMLANDPFLDARMVLDMCKKICEMHKAALSG